MHRLASTLFVALMPTGALAQGGHFGEGGSGSLLHVLLGLTVALGLLIAIGLMLVRPNTEPAVWLPGPVALGAVLALPIMVGAVVVIVWLESLAAGAVVALGLAAAYVAIVARRWRR